MTRARHCSPVFVTEHPVALMGPSEFPQLFAQPVYCETLVRSRRDHLDGDLPHPFSLCVELGLMVCGGEPLQADRRGGRQNRFQRVPLLDFPQARKGFYHSWTPKRDHCAEVESQKV